MALAAEFPQYICSVVSQMHIQVSKLLHFAYPENLSLRSIKILETVMKRWKTLKFSKIVAQCYLRKEAFHFAINSIIKLSVEYWPLDTQKTWKVARFSSF